VELQQSQQIGELLQKLISMELLVLDVDLSQTSLKLQKKSQHSNE